MSEPATRRARIRPLAVRRSPALVLIAITLAALFAPLLNPVTSNAMFVDAAAVGSNRVSTITVQPPGPVSATNGATIKLTWSATPTTAAQGYRVYRSGTSGTVGSLVATVTPRTTVTWTDSAPLPGANYYVVRAYVYNFVSGYTAESTGQSTMTYSDTFSGSGALGTTEQGGATWLTANGSWNRNGSGRAGTATPAASNPMLYINAQTADADTTISTTAASGEAIYSRIAGSGATWSRARVRQFETTSQYYVTEYGHPVYSTEYEYTDRRQVPQWQPRIQETEQTTTAYDYTAWSDWSKTVVESECRSEGAPSWGANDTYDSYGIIIENRRWQSYGYGNKGCGPNYAMWYVEKKNRSRYSTGSTAAWVTTCTASDTAYSVVTCGTTRLTNSGSPYYAATAAGPYDYQTGSYGYLTYGNYWAFSPRDGDDIATGNTRQTQTSTTWNTTYCGTCPTRQAGPYTTTTTSWEIVAERLSGTGLVTIGSWACPRPNSLRVTVVGTTYTVYVNGTQLATFAHSQNSGSTQHGAGLGGADTVNEISGLNDFTLTTL